MNNFLVSFLKKISLVAEAVPSLCFLGNKSLKTKTTFSSFDNAIKTCKNLEEALLKIREITGVGRGLAAPQISSDERCFVTFVDNEFQYFINPSIHSYSDKKNWYRENCLSCGPISCDIERSETIEMSFLDKSGNQKRENFSGFWARLLQHELDHLDGIVNILKTNTEDIELISNDPTEEKLRDEKD